MVQSEEVRWGESIDWRPLVVLWAVIAVELALTLTLNGGMLMYSFDDPYIHLALAERIREGHFGLNPVEACSPSSSILWPFLLAPFSPWSAVEWVPLGLNVLFASVTLCLVQRALASGLEGATRGLVSLLTILAIPAMNLVGLVFTGMEHSLQVLCAVGLVLGLLRAVEGEGGSPPWLAFFVVLGPLVRYENAALSTAALLWLWWNGERGRALACGALVALGLGAYSLFLHGLGLPPLPASVMAKSAVVSPGQGFKAIVYALYHNLSSTPGVLMSLAALALVVTSTRPSRPPAERRLARCMACALVLHLLVGRFGWYSRYEIYAWSAGILALFYLWRAPLSVWANSQSLWKTAAVGLVAISITCREYVIVLANTSLASHNVYLQQYQLHRCATEFLDEPVAVNDLGWVAFHNSNYVLDLWGLGSIEALEARRNERGSAWIAPLAAKHGVRTAMIYDSWFEDLPASWRRVGTLHMNVPRVTPDQSAVAFYALDPAWEEELTRRLRAFEKSLPEGATFSFGGDPE